VHFMVINRTRPDLTAAQYQELGKLAEAFYTAPPAGIRLHSDWAAADGSGTYAILEAESLDLLEQVQTPFRPFVAMENIQVRPLSGWRK